MVNIVSSCPVCSHNKFNNIFSSDNIPEYNLNYLNNIYESLNYKTTKVKFVECKYCGFLKKRTGIKNEVERKKMVFEF